MLIFWRRPIAIVLPVAFLLLAGHRLTAARDWIPEGDPYQAGVFVSHTSDPRIGETINEQTANFDTTLNLLGGEFQGTVFWYFPPTMPAGTVHYDQTGTSTHIRLEQSIETGVVVRGEWTYPEGKYRDPNVTIALEFGNRWVDPPQSDTTKIPGGDTGLTTNDWGMSVVWERVAFGGFDDEGRMGEHLDTKVQIYVRDGDQLLGSYIAQVRSLYRALPEVNDQVAIEDPSINITPIPSDLHSKIQNGVLPLLQVTVWFRITSAASAQLLSKVYAIVDGQRRQIGVSERAEVFRNQNWSVQSTAHRDLQIPPEATELWLVGELLETGTDSVLAESDPFKIPLQPSQNDLKVSRIEFVQAIQNSDQDVPLFAGKPSVVRVFPEASQEDLRGVGGRLCLVKKGTQTTRDCGAHLLNGPITAKFIPNRNVEHDSLNFRLPDDWVDSAVQITVEAEILPPDGFLEADTTDNKLEATRDLVASEQLRIVYLGVRYRPPGARPGGLRPDGRIASADRLLKRYFPLAPNSISYRGVRRMSTWRRPLTYREDGEVKAHRRNIRRLLRALDRFYVRARLQHRTDGWRADQLIGWLPNFRSSVAGTSYPTWSGGSGRVAVLKDRAPWYNSFGMAHEIGHNLGQLHPGTGHRRDGPRSNSAYSRSYPWPYPDASISDPGFDTVAWRFKVRTKKDLMSYWYRPLSNIWVSAHTYTGILNSQFRPHPSATSSRSETVTRSANGDTRYFLVSGTIARDGSVAELDPIYAIDYSPDAAPAGEGEYCIEVAEAGQAAAQRCFDLSFEDPEAEPGEEAIEDQYFVKLVPWSPAADTIALRQSGRLLTSINSSANAPAVTITSPAAGETWDGGERTITWTGDDADGEALTYSVEQSWDSRGNWFLLEEDLAETSLELNAGQIEGGDAVWFRVTASDGFRTGSAEVGPLTIVHRPQISVETVPIDAHQGVVGTPRESVFEIANTGSGSLTVTNIASSGPEFRVTDPPTPFEVLPGWDREVSVEFTAPNEGEHTATLRITSDSTTTAELDVPIRGVGITTPVPEADVSPTALDFGEVSVGESATGFVVLENHGPGELAFQSISVSDAQFSHEVAAPYQLGVGMEPLEITFTPTSAGAKSATLTINTDNPEQSVFTVQLSGTASGGSGGGPGPGPGIRPAIGDGGVVNGASGQPTLSRGGIGSIYGADLAPSVSLAQSVPLPTVLAGVRVQVNGADVPLYFVSPGQINFQVPWIAPLDGAIQVVVIRDGVASAAVNATVKPYAPGIFINPNTGEPIVQRHADGSLITAANRARPNDVLVVWHTGVGDVSNAPATGDLSPASPLATARQFPEVTVGGEQQTVYWTGLGPGMVGVGQTNIQLGARLVAPAVLPDGARAVAGTLPLVIAFGDMQSQAVNLPAEVEVVSQPAIQVTPTSVNFKDVEVGTTADAQVRIENVGQAALNVSEFALESGAFALVPAASATMIPPGGQHTVTVRFQPQAAGQQLAQLTIHSNDPSQPAFVVTLAGNGTVTQTGTPRMVVDSATVDFGPVAVGESATQSFRITNAGDGPLEVQSITSDDQAVTVLSPAVPFQVAPGAHQDVVLEFRPVADGPLASNVTISTNEVAAPTFIVRAEGQGVDEVETDLVSGVPVALTMPPVAVPTLYTGDFTIAVPPGATQLEVRLQTVTPNVDLDLFVRYGQDVALAPEGVVVADFSSTSLTGSELIVIDANSTPPLQSGRYHIGLGQFTTNVAAEFLLTATVTTGGPGGQAVRVRASRSEQQKQKEQLEPLRQLLSRKLR